MEGAARNPTKRHFARVILRGIASMLGDFRTIHHESAKNLILEIFQSINRLFYPKSPLRGIQGVSQFEIAEASLSVG
jgi:hypothetical protein